MEEYIKYHKIIIARINDVISEIWDWFGEWDPDLSPTPNGWYLRFDWWKNKQGALDVCEAYARLESTIDESPYGDHVRGGWYNLGLELKKCIKEKLDCESFYNKFSCDAHSLMSTMDRVEFSFSEGSGI